MQGQGIRRRLFSLAAAGAPEHPPDTGETRRKRTFKEQRELESLPPLIETLQTELAVSHAAMATALSDRPSGDVLAHDRNRVRDVESRPTAAFTRWETLEAGGARTGSP